MYPETAYSRLSDKERRSSDESSNHGQDRDSLFSIEENLRSLARSTPLKRRLPWIAHGVAFLIWLAVIVYTVTLSRPTRRTCLEKFNAYSPILDAIDTDYHEERFKYSLWYQSPFKGPPTPEVNQAWHEIMQYGQVSVTASDILRIGHNLTSVRYPPHIGGGGYPATAMGTHAIHCLHYVWQDHYLAVSPDVQALKHDIPEMYERHYEHCVDYIRQYLMCKFDATVMPFSWVLDHQNPTPNGNTVHKCVDWGYLQGWLKGRAVEMPEGFEWRQPEDAVRLDWNP